MWDLDYKKSWALKNWCFWTVVLEKTLDKSPLDCKEIQPVHSKGDQSWVSLEGLMLKLKLQYFGHLIRRVDSLEKTLMLGGIVDRRRRGWQMMRWHHRLDGREFEWTPGVGDGQGSLACCNSWGHKESDMTEWMNWTELNMSLLLEAPHVVLMVKNPPANVRHKRHRFNPWDRKILWWRAWQPTPIFLPGESWLPWAEEPGRLWFIGLYDWSN